MQRGALTEAIAAFEQALVASPDDVWVLDALGFSYFSVARFADAERDDILHRRGNVEKFADAAGFESSHAMRKVFRIPDFRP